MQHGYEEFGVERVGGRGMGTRPEPCHGLARANALVWHLADLNLAATILWHTRGNLNHFAPFGCS